MMEYLLSFVPVIKPRDIIDIAIVATFIYLILIWLKKARARLILIGMLILAVVYFLARALGMYLTTMLLQTFFAVALLIVVIIFQDELRYFFEHIALWGLKRRGASSTPFARSINILSTVLANLARKKIGALVVVRGKDPLDRHIETKIDIDAILNEILLESIFTPSAPSHDGAVIVEGLQITKFSCHLPLSTNISEVGRLGTRHAAALGLAERTDALCLVVSEEQGTISAAEEGQLRHIGDITQLQRILGEFYAKKFPAPQKNIFFVFVTRHLLEKILAVLLACALWFVFVHRTETIRRDFAIPIEYRNLSPSVFIKEPKPKDITLTLSGSEQVFSLFNPQDLRLALDLSQIKDGENEFMVSKEMVKVPQGLSVVNLESEKIAISAYRLVPLNVQVDLVTEGRAPSGIVIKQIKVEPKEIKVLIPSTSAREKIRISTETIDLKAISDTATIIPRLTAPAEVRFPDDKQPEVKVIVEVEKKE